MRNDTRHLARGLAAALALAVLLLGIPAALLALGGNPLPGTIPTLDEVGAALTSPDDGGLFLTALLWIAWIGWATFAVSALLELPAQLRGTPRPRVPGLGLQQQLAAGLIAAVLVTITGPLAGPAAAQPAGSTQEAPPATAAEPISTADTAAAQAPAAAPAPAGPTAAPTHVVQPGDTLWDIAEHHLGDGQQWRAIAALNYAAPQPDGGALDDTHTLHPGWQLTLPTASTGSDRPADATAATTRTVQSGDTLSGIADDELGDPARYPELAQASAATVQPDGDRLTDPDLIRPGWQITIPTPTPPAAAAAAPSPVAPEPAPPPPAAAPVTPNPPASGPTEPSLPPVQPPQDGSVPAAPGQTPHAVPPQSDDAPATDADEAGEADDEPFNVATSTGIGALLAAGLLFLLGAKRRQQQRRRRPGQRIPMPPPPAHVTELEVRAVEDPVGVDHIDTALRALAVRHRVAGRPLPPLRAARLTSSHLELYLAAPADLAPPWTGTSDAAVWLLPHEELTPPRHDRQTDTRAPYPALVTIGQDSEDAHLLLDLEYVTALAVDGAPTDTLAVITALAIELATSAWADDLQVTLVGCRPELPDALGTGRIRHLDRIERLIVELEGRADDVARVMIDAGVEDLPTARGLGVARDAWAPEIVLLADGVPAHLRDRLDAVLHRVPRVGIAAVTGAGQQLGEWVLRLQPTPPPESEEPVTALLQPAGITVRPQRVNDEQYARIISLLETADDVAVPGPAWAADLPSDEPTVDDLPAPASTDGEGSRSQQRDPDSTAVPAAEEHDNADPAGTDTVTAAPGEPFSGADTAAATVSPPDADRAPVHVSPLPEGGEPALAAVHRLPAAAAPAIRVLGRVEVTGARGPEPRTANSNHTGPATELLAFLAVHGAAATGEEIAAHIVGNRGNWTLNTVRTRANQARTWLGADDDGHPYLPSATDAGRYQLHSDVRSDWDDWLALVGDAAADAATDTLLAALALVRDQPFAGVRSRSYGWADLIRQEMIASIIDIAHEVARRAVLDGDYSTVRRAAATGRLVDPANELIARDALRAEYIAGDTAGFTRIKDQLYALADDLDTELEEETEQLIDDLEHRAGTAVAL